MPRRLWHPYPTTFDRDACSRPNRSAAHCPSAAGSGGATYGSAADYIRAPSSGRVPPGRREVDVVTAIMGVEPLRKTAQTTSPAPHKRDRRR